MTLLAIVAISFFIPWSWTVAVWDWLLSKAWKRSSLKLGVEVAGKKVKSFKDKRLTEKMKKERAKASDTPI